MLQKTRGVVFRFTKYGETSIIVNIFTEVHGLQAYIVNGVRSKSLRSKIALYQPLTLLDLVVYHRENANIKRIKEVKCLHAYRTISSDVRKSAIAMFITEMVNRSIREESHASELCEFLISSLITLDTIDHAENFHIIFLLKLSRYLGFGVYDARELSVGNMSDADEKVVGAMIDAEYATPLPPFGAVQRRDILDAIIRFYQRHIETLGEIKSVSVLREILG